MVTSVANPPIIPGELSNARHAPRLLNCLATDGRRWAGAVLMPSTHFTYRRLVSLVDAAARLASMTYEHARHDLI